MARNASIITLFAESIRDEASGQISLVGVFDDVLEIAETPTQIPSLELLITVSTLIADPFVMTSFRIYFEDGLTLMAHDFPEEILEAQHKAISESKTEDPSREWMSARIRAGLRNVQIDANSLLCIEATDVNGNTAKSNKLRIAEKDTKPTTNISV